MDEVIERETSMIRVSISDNGIGMGDQIKHLIMDGRVKPSKDKTRGLGIGLSLVKKIVDHVGGKFIVEDGVAGDPTQGTVVHLLLRRV